MKEQGLVSKYTVAQFKPTKTTCNESDVGNVLNREFDQDQELKVVVSDLTYVRVDQKWHYICILVDLYNREIIGYSAGPQKTAALVQRAFASVPRSEEHTSELQSRGHLVCRLLLEKK